jgi:hypothetical protein
MKRLRFGNLLRERVEREVSGRYLSRAGEDGMLSKGGEGEREREARGGRRTFYESSLEVWRPDGFALSLEGLPALPATDNGIDSVSCPIITRQGI